MDSRFISKNYKHVVCLLFKLKKKFLFQLYMINNYELPATNLNGESEVLKSKITQSMEINFNVYNIVNDDGVRGVPLDKRLCRFADEVVNDNNAMYKIYSVQACSTDVKRKILFIILQKT